MKLVVPALKDDLDVIISNKDYYFLYLHIDEIIVLGNEEVEKRIADIEGVRYINERTVCDFDTVYDAVIRRDARAEKRVGWYYQQFLKMNFSFISEDEFYYLWDCDTVPVRRVQLFQDETPFFDCKKEYNKAYFDTITTLFPDINKEIERSFISEHMLINKRYMIELIQNISNLNIQGSTWVEKVINAIPRKYIRKSGFSEYELYGNYMHKRHRGVYSIRAWDSLRFGSFYINKGSRICEDIISWLGTEYDAISFEKNQELSIMSHLIKKDRFRNLFSPRKLVLYTYALRLKRKIFHNYG